MVAERLAVGGGDHETTEVEGSVDDAQARRRLEGEGVGERGVVDDERDRPVRVVRVAPPVDAAPRRDIGVDLPRGQDREADALLGQHPEHEVVHRRLRKPHALGAPAEPVREVEDPPPHMGADVALVAEREDGVAVRLRDGAARRAIGVHDAAVHVGMVRLEPREQRGPDVERQLLEGAERRRWVDSTRR